MHFKWFHRFLDLHLKIHGDNDDDWLYTEEPHSARRKEILKKHPEIKRLMGYDPWITAIVTVEVFAQLFMAWLLRDANWATIVICAYIIGGSLNHSLGSAIHEIGHNLAFGHRRPKWNRILSIWCNLPMGIPMAVSYKKYHADHHLYLGEENQDVDIPTRLESALFRHPITKIFWLFIHPLLHSLRPFYKSPKPVTGWEIINSIVQVIFDVILFKILGGKALAYLVIGTFWGHGIHPLSAHFISEHYNFNDGQATHSYYGPLNIVLFNVGYHVEHHDFPYIPYRKLPELRKMAPEYYDLPDHKSWLKVLWDFVFDKNMGPHARGVGYLREELYEKSE